MRTLGLVPARGGSKGIPGKNVKLLRGKPLLQYTIDAAFKAKCLDKVLLSTDDEEIAEVGRCAGLDVPFLRPERLARDDTPTLPVVQHAIRWVESEGEEYDAVCLLQPTTPLRLAEDIDACIQMLEREDADAVISVLQVPPRFNPHWVFFANGSGSLRPSVGLREPIPRRQDLPDAFIRDGSVYVTRRDVVMEKDSLYGERVLGYQIDPSRSVNIDTLEDWAAAEARLAERGNEDNE